MIIAETKEGVRVQQLNEEMGGLINSVDFASLPQETLDQFYDIGDRITSIAESLASYYGAANITRR